MVNLALDMGKCSPTHSALVFDIRVGPLADSPTLSSLDKDRTVQLALSFGARLGMINTPLRRKVLRDSPPLPESSGLRPG